MWVSHLFYYSNEILLKESAFLIYQESTLEKREEICKAIL